MGDAQPGRVPAEEGVGQRRLRPLPRRGADGRRRRPPRRPLGGPGRPRQPRRARRGGRQPARAAAALPQRGGARTGLDRVRPRGRLPRGRAAPRPARTAAPSARRSRVHWNGQQQVQEVSGGSGLLRPEPAPAALRPRRRRRSSRRRWCAGRRARPRSWPQPRSRTACTRSRSRRDATPRARPRARARGSASTTATWPRSWSRSSSSWARSPSASWRAGRARSWPSPPRSLVELLLGRLLWGKWPHLASAYISGISVGMLVRSPEFWPYALCAAISITSKYVLRVDGRHLWNPSNFGIVAMLVLAADAVAGLSVQWGNNLLPMVVVWGFGSVIIHRLGPLPHHADLRRVVPRLLRACARAVTGHPWPAEVAPITGPMYQLYIFFMITDPKTTVHAKRGQCLVAFLVAAVEAVLAAARVRPRAVLRAVHRRSGREPGRDRCSPAARSARAGMRRADESRRPQEATTWQTPPPQTRRRS